MKRSVSILSLAALLAVMGFLGGGNPLVARASCGWNNTGTSYAYVPYTDSYGQGRLARFSVLEWVDHCGHIEFSSESCPNCTGGADPPHWAYAGLQVFENGVGIFDSYAFNGNNPPGGITETTPQWTCHTSSNYVAKDTQTTYGINYLFKSTWTPTEVQNALLTVTTGTNTC